LESRRTRQFVALFEQLPTAIQKQARDAYRQWVVNPSHPGLEFKKLRHRSRAIYSVRIGIGWRALGVIEADRII
jgi:hypothetical protein